MLTEAAIKSAIKKLLASENISAELRDGGERGTGRLALQIRVTESGTPGAIEKNTAQEWYAIWHRGGRRRMSKIGNYPKLGLADARKIFRDNYARHIELGEDPTGPRARRGKDGGFTVKNLFEAYVASLKKSGAASARQVERALLGPDGKGGAAKAIGPDLIAGSVTADDITPILKKVYGRGSKYMADSVRSMISAAFGFGIRSRNDYRQSDAPDWGIKTNPMAYVPGEEKNPGQRYLRPAEFTAFWRWLEARDRISSAAPAIRVMMVTGQRITEILRIDKLAYDAPEKIADWSKTKNGSPHAIPLPSQAVKIFDHLTVNAHGLYFPGRKRANVPMTGAAVLGQIHTYLEDTGAEHFTARDLRRTWKTLAGAAGIPKDIRDRIQNHAMSDVGSKHYDRWSYMPEKRAAMAAWEGFLDKILAGEIENVPALSPEDDGGED